MASKHGDEAAKERAERASRMLKRITANKEFMREIEEGLESERLGKGVPFKGLKRVADTNV